MLRPIANALTLARLLAVLPFTVLLATADGGRSLAAAAIFTLASLTDYLDGVLARRAHEPSRFGRVADPIADRLLINMALILLWYAGRLPWWLALPVLTRDVWLMFLFRRRHVGTEVDGQHRGEVGHGAHHARARAAHGHLGHVAACALRGRGGGLARRRSALLGATARGGVRVKAVVMAGGEGTRLRPLTSNQPKPMVPVAGKPCMEHIIDLLRRHGMTDIVVTVAYLPQVIRGYFDDGGELGVELHYSVEETPLGTAGSVKNAAELLDETFLVISGDALCDFDLGALVEAHKRRGAAATLALYSVENPLEFGVVITDSDGRVERFLEKPSWGQVFSDTINTGVYVLEPEVLAAVPDGTSYDFSKQLFPDLLQAREAGVRASRRGLLAGHREPRPVPQGELRRPRRAHPARGVGDPAARQRRAR